MKKNNNIEKKFTSFQKLLLIILGFYPVIPAYFKVLGFSSPNLCYLLLILAAIVFKQRVLKVKLNFLNLVIAFWLLINLFLYFYHGYYFGALWAFLLVAAGIVVSGTVKTKDLFFKILINLCNITGVICILGLFESFTGFNIWSYLNNSGANISINPPRFGITRIVSFTYQTISYSVYLTIIACVVFYLLSCKNNLDKKTVLRLKIDYLLIIINIVLTLSRSGILLFVFTQFLLLIKTGGKHFLKTVIRIVIVFLLFIFFVSVAFPSLYHFLQNFYYMILAVFDDRYTSLIASEFGKDNLNVTGTRLIIYKWVWQKVNGKYVLGVGYNTPFSYFYDAGNIYHTVIEKTAIEVEYLLTFYESGFLGLIAEICVFISLLVSSVSNKFQSSSCEGKIGFNYLFFVIVLGLVLVYFSVNQSSEQYIFYLLISMHIAYNQRRKYISQI